MFFFFFCNKSVLFTNIPLNETIDVCINKVLQETFINEYLKMIFVIY